MLGFASGANFPVSFMSSSIRGEVLIADGDPSVRGLLSAIVHRLDRRPVAVGDGNEAGRLLATRDFDAILLDLILPERSGVEVLDGLEAADPQRLRKVIVVTTLPPEACRHRQQIAAFLRKPFTLDDLTVALLTCCGEA
jgi:CheY-like chemotaxis protein